jgi:integrase
MEEFRKLCGQKALATVWKGNLRAYTAFLVSASCSMRIGEIQALTVKDICERYIRVRHSMERKYGLKSTKNGKERLEPLAGVVKMAIADLCTDITEEPGFLFSATRGKTVVDHKTITERFKKAVIASGIPPEDVTRRKLTFHSLRHFFATTMDGELDRESLMQQTGHSDERSLLVYIHQNEKQLNKAYEAVERTFSVLDIDTDI